jgi:hypothetical protein
MTKAESKQKRKRGRPPVLTPQVEEQLITLVIEGNTVSAACRKLRVGYSTVARKEVEGGNFGSLLARARVAGAAVTLDEAEDTLRKATSKNVMRARELAAHLRWKASKLMPLYGDDRRRAAESAQEEPDKKFAEMTDSERLDWLRRAAWSFAQIGDEFLKDWLRDGPLREEWADAFKRFTHEFFKAGYLVLNPVKPALPSPQAVPSKPAPAEEAVQEPVVRAQRTHTPARGDGYVYGGGGAAEQGRDE